MITEPQTDRASVSEDQKLRDNIESFERKYLDYRFEEVEDGETEDESISYGATADASSP